MTDDYHPIDLRVERLRSADCIDRPAPEFSWRLGPGQRQTAYQLRVWRADAKSAPLLWTSQTVASDCVFGAQYGGPELSSFTRYAWSVRIWADDVEGPWSPPAYFETGALAAGDWRAEWIGDPEAAPQRPIYLRGVLTAATDVVRARAYVSALGWYRFFINGQDKTGPALVPRWTPLDHMVEYQCYDITSDLREGANDLAIAVGDGRYRGYTGFAERREIYGAQLAGFVQIRVEYADGRIETCVSDADWRAADGPILRSDPKRGEAVDLRISSQTWLGLADPPQPLRPVSLIEPPSRVLIAEQVERVQAVGRRRPIRVWRAPSGKLLVDFGQNMAGVARVRLRQPEGTRLTFTFSEIVGRSGELDIDYLFDGPPGGHPPQRDEVIVGQAGSWWQPWFTIHGFRYLEVDGATQEMSPDDFEAITLSSAIDYTGSFRCSDERLNRLVDNVRWGMISNFVDTPTDCPTRERSGWTGDIQIFSRSAAVLADVQPYLRRFLRNLAVEQRPTGAIPPYIPFDEARHSGRAPFIVRAALDSVGWGDASVLLPDTLHRNYGDRIVLEQQYASMTRWLGHLVALARRSPGRGRLLPRRLGGLERFVIDSGFHYGEWLRPGESMPLLFVRSLLRAPAVVATAYLAHSAHILSEIAGLLGKDTDRASYAELADRTRAAWQAAFVRKGGARIGADRQDDYVRALAFDLLPTQSRKAAINRLVELIEEADHHLDTGFLSTPLLLPTLARFGRTDIAFRLLLQDTHPSWLHQVDKGATTVWESWEGFDRKGNAHYSHNHYAFGTVVAWLFEGVAGIKPAEPGYRRIRFAPIIGGDLDFAEATIATPFGPASSSWRRHDNTVELDVEVPPGATGVVVTSGGVEHDAPAGRSRFTWKMDHEEMAI